MADYGTAHNGPEQSPPGEAQGFTASPITPIDWGTGHYSSNPPPEPGTQGFGEPPRRQSSFGPASNFTASPLTPIDWGVGNYSANPRPPEIDLEDASLSSSFSVSLDFEEVKKLNLNRDQTLLGPMLFSPATPSLTDHDINYRSSSYVSSFAELVSEFVLEVEIGRTRLAGDLDVVVEMLSALAEYIDASLSFGFDQSSDVTELKKLSSSLSSDLVQTSAISTEKNLGSDISSSFTSTSDIEEVITLSSALVASFDKESDVEGSFDLSADLTGVFSKDSDVTVVTYFGANQNSEAEVTANAATFFKLSANNMASTFSQSSLFGIRKSLSSALASNFLSSAKIDPLIAVRSQATFKMNAVIIADQFEADLRCNFILRNAVDYADDLGYIAFPGDSTPQTAVVEGATPFTKRPYYSYPYDILDVNSVLPDAANDGTFVLDSVPDDWVTHYPVYFKYYPVVAPYPYMDKDPQVIRFPGSPSHYVSNTPPSSPNNVGYLIEDDLEVSIRLRNFEEVPSRDPQYFITKGDSFKFGILDSIVFLTIKTENGEFTYEYSYNPNPTGGSGFGEPFRVGQPYAKVTEEAILVDLREVESTVFTVVRDTQRAEVTFRVNGVNAYTYEDVDTSPLVDIEQEIRIGENLNALVTAASAGSIRKNDMFNPGFGDPRQFPPLSKYGYDLRGNEWVITHISGEDNADVLDRNTWVFCDGSFFDFEVEEYPKLNFGFNTDWTILAKIVSTADSTSATLVAKTFSRRSKVDGSLKPGHLWGKATNDVPNGFVQDEDFRINIRHVHINPFKSVGEEPDPADATPDHEIPRRKLYSQEWASLGSIRETNDHSLYILFNRSVNHVFEYVTDPSNLSPLRVGAGFADPNAKVFEILRNGGFAVSDDTENPNFSDYFKFNGTVIDGGDADDVFDEENDELLDGGGAGDSSAIYFYDGYRDGGSSVAFITDSYDAGNAGSDDEIFIDGGNSRYADFLGDEANPWFGYLESIAFFGNPLSDEKLGEFVDWDGSIPEEPDFIREESYIYRHASRYLRSGSLDDDFPKLVTFPARQDADFGTPTITNIMEPPAIIDEYEEFGLPFIDIGPAIYGGGISEGGIGTPKVVRRPLNITVASISDVEFGSTQISSVREVFPESMGGEAFGVPSAGQPVRPSSFTDGIVSTPMVRDKRTITLNSPVHFGEFFGKPELKRFISRVSARQGEEMGTPRVNAAQTIELTGINSSAIGSLELFAEDALLRPEGIGSGEDFGEFILSTNLITIEPEPVYSTSAIGSPEVISEATTIKVYRDGSFEERNIMRWNGSTWVPATVRRWNGSEWVNI